MSARSPVPESEGSGEPLRIGVCGASGRMGRLVCRLALADPRLSLRAALVSPGSQALGRDVGPLCGAAPAALAASDDLAWALACSDVIIDFSSPSATAHLLRHAAARGGGALVIGTTGLGEAEEKEIERAARILPVLRSANMSVGVNVLLGLVERASQALPGFDVEIVEVHHRMKQDAPSGTALMLGAGIARQRGMRADLALRAGRAGRTSRRGEGEIGISAVRGGDVVGEHTVHFLGAGERIELTHRASSREIFAHGAIRAAIWLAGRPPGLYEMGDVLGLR